MSHTIYEGTKMQAGIEQLTESETYRLLAVKRRRLALEILIRSSAPVELEALAAAVTERETDREIGDETAVEDAAITLHHLHLPMMADLDVIDYDPEASQIESCPASRGS